MNPALVSRMDYRSPPQFVSTQGGHCSRLPGWESGAVATAAGKGARRGFVPVCASGMIIRMPAPRRHVFVCTHGSFCWADGDPDELLEALKKMVAAAGLKDEIRINRSGCLNACGLGPTVVVYPEGVWYGNVQPGDAAEIFESHLLNGVPVERLRLPADFRKDTARYPDAVHQMKRVERSLDDQRRAAQESIRSQLRAEDRSADPTNHER